MTDPHELFADKLIHAYRRSGTIFIHGVAVALALAGFLVTELPVLPIVTWLAFLMATMGAHAYRGKKLMVEERRAMAGVNNRSLMILAALAGLGWGSGAAFLPFVSPPLQLLVVLALTAIGAASLPRMAALPTIHMAFMAGLFLPVVVALVFVFGVGHWMMVGVILIIWAELTHEARKAHVELVELYSARQALQDEAERDKLTGIANRRAFDAALEREWRRAQRYAVPLSLVMIDVDFFKKYNDRYGHPAGDECLAGVAKTLAARPRRSGDLVARYGGEEFVVLLFHTPRDDALALAESLRRAVEDMRIPHQDGPMGVASISLGGATCIPAPGEAAETLVQAADAALYQAKAAGRNRVVWSAGRETAAALRA